MPSLIGSGVTGFNNSTTLSVALDIPATGSNRCLVVAVYAYNGGTDTITGVTYNSVALTFHGRWSDTGASGAALSNSPIEFWYLVNPSTASSFNIVASAGPGAPSELGLMAQAFSDVHQTTPLGTVTGSHGTNVTSTSDTVSLSGSDIALAALTCWRNGAFTVTPNGTQIVEDENGASVNSIAFQYRATGTLGWSFNQTLDIANVAAVALKDVGSAAPSLVLPIVPTRVNTLLRM